MTLLHKLYPERRLFEIYPQGDETKYEAAVQGIYAHYYYNDAHFLMDRDHAAFAQRKYTQFPIHPFERNTFDQIDFLNGTLFLGTHKVSYVVTDPVESPQRIKNEELFFYHINEIKKSIEQKGRMRLRLREATPKEIPIIHQFNPEQTIIYIENEEQYNQVLSLIVPQHQHAWLPYHEIELQERPRFFFKENERVDLDQKKLTFSAKEQEAFIMQRRNILSAIKELEKQNYVVEPLDAKLAQLKFL